MSGRLTTDYSQDQRLFKTTPQRWVAAVLTVVAIAIPFLLQQRIGLPFGFPWTQWSSVVNFALIAAIAAAAFNLLLGYTGQVSLAHVAFLILGAVTGFFFGQTLGLSFFLVIPLAAALGALMGALVGLPAIRVRGLYLLIATLAVHFFAVQAFRRYQIGAVGFTGLRYESPEIPTWLHWLPLIDPGADGRFLISGDFRWYWVLISITALCILAMHNLTRSRHGRSFVAVRDNDIAAEVMGIDIVAAKLRAFAASSAFVAVAGVLLSYYIGARSDESWSVQVVLDYATMIVVGGFSSIQGGVLGAFFFFGVPVLVGWVRGLPGLREIDFLQARGAEIELMLFGVVVVAVLVFKPDGLAGAWNDVKRYFRHWPYRY